MRSSADAFGRERNDSTSRRVECRRLEGSESDCRGGARALASEFDGWDADESWDVTGRRSTRLYRTLASDFGEWRTGGHVSQV